MLRTGYHYTTHSHLKGIQASGLVPYEIPSHIKSAMAAQGITNPPLGVWLWQKDPRGKSHFGNVLFQMAKKGEDVVVKLAVEYDDKDVLRAPTGKNMSLAHNGYIEKWVYHRDEPAVVVKKTISPDRIRVVGVYNPMESFSRDS